MLGLCVWLVVLSLLDTIMYIRLYFFCCPKYYVCIHQCTTCAIHKYQSTRSSQCCVMRFIFGSLDQLLYCFFTPSCPHTLVSRKFSKSRHLARQLGNWLERIAIKTLVLLNLRFGSTVQVVISVVVLLMQFCGWFVKSNENIGLLTHWLIGTVRYIHII